MSPEELRSRGRRVADELINHGDLAIADELVGADHVDLSPWGLLGTGAEGVKRLVVELRRAFPDLRGLIDDQIVDGDTLVQRIRVTGTHDGPFLGLAATGRRATFVLLDISRVGPDGEFAEMWSLADQPGLLRQLGALPTDLAQIGAGT
jgi:predicted ester cyclase